MLGMAPLCIERHLSVLVFACFRQFSPWKGICLLRKTLVCLGSPLFLFLFLVFLPSTHKEKQFPSLLPFRSNRSRNLRSSGADIRRALVDGLLQILHFDSSPSASRHFRYRRSRRHLANRPLSLFQTHRTFESCRAESF